LVGSGQGPGRNKWGAPTASSLYRAPPGTNSTGLKCQDTPRRDLEVVWWCTDGAGGGVRRRRRAEGLPPPTRRTRRPLRRLLGREREPDQDCALHHPRACCYVSGFGFRFMKGPAMAGAVSPWKRLHFFHESSREGGRSVASSGMAMKFGGWGEGPVWQSAGVWAESLNPNPGTRNLRRSWP